MILDYGIRIVEIKHGTNILFMELW